jgi:ketosteroid isomerase-like protein
MRTPAAFPVLLLLGACQTAVPEGLSDADRAAIDQLSADYAAAALAADWDAWTELWTTDAVYQVPDGPALVGHAEIRASVDAFTVPPTEMNATVDAMDGSGKWAWARGNFVFAVPETEDMPEVRMVGSFLWVLEKQPDGTWLIDTECYNSDMPPEMPPEG